MRSPIRSSPGSGALRALLLLLGALAGVPPASGQAPDPVAVVVRATDAVQIARAGRALPATPGTRLAAGDRVLLGRGGRAVLLHASGRLETLTRSALLAPPSERTTAPLFTRTLRTLTQVATADVRAQPNREGVIRPIPGAPAAIAPRNGIAVATSRPTLVWSEMPGAQGYTVQLRPEEGKPLRYATGADTVWTLPDSAAPLEPGGTYEWTVATSPSGRPAQPQRFRVATLERREQVEQRLTELREAGLDPDGDGLFLAALAYRDAGLLYAADGALERVARTGGEGGRVFHLLRAEVYRSLGRTKAAACELAAAEAAGDP